MNRGALPHDSPMVRKAIFMDGPVDRLGRLLADACNSSQFLRVRSHHMFEGSEVINEMLGAFRPHSMETRQNPDLERPFAHGPSSGTIRRGRGYTLELPRCVADQPGRFLLALRSQHRNAEYHR